MALLEKQLVVAESQIPNSGKGLFTKVDIKKGTRIVEYKGRISTWKEADIDEGRNAYLFRVKSYHTIDARPYPSALARYANDAKGFRKIKGKNNNCIYVVDGLKVYIEAVKDIPAGTEILVDYGQEYWQVMKRNLRIDEQVKKAQEKMRLREEKIQQQQAIATAKANAKKAVRAKANSTTVGAKKSSGKKAGTKKSATTKVEGGKTATKNTAAKTTAVKQKTKFTRTKK